MYCGELWPSALRSSPDRMLSACASTGPWHHGPRSEEHTSELQSHSDLVCRLLLEKKKNCRGLSRNGEKDVKVPTVAHARRYEFHEVGKEVAVVTVVGGHHARVLQERVTELMKTEL